MTERRKMKKPENVWFLLGALAVLAMGIPYLILGKDAICSVGSKNGSTRRACRRTCEKRS